MFARRAVKILHSFTALFPESWQAISRRQEPRIRTDVADQRGLSAAIRRIRENPRFLLLQSCVCRFGGANLAAHARRVRNARYITNATHARRLICFIACFSLILSTQPTVPAGMGKSAEKPNAHLRRGLPGLNLPNLNKARRMSPAVPKIAPPVSAASASKVGPPAPAPPPVQDDNLPMAMLAPMNRVGTGGEDLLSRNFNWGLPLVGLPGRAGLDLNLTLSLNSLIWTKSGGNIHFDNSGFPSPGFHLGFPELKTYFYNSEAGTGSRLVVMPSGERCEFWENTALEDGSAYIYEERTGSNMIIVEVPGLFDPSETVWSLLMPDGTAYKYVVVGDDPKCVQMEDRNGNYISVAYNTSTEKITKITDTADREVDFNYDVGNRLTSITQNWAGGTHTWATFTYSTVTISAGFLSLNMVGAQNSQTIPVLSRVGLADGSVYSFDYNTYGQVYTINRYAPNTATPSDFPDDYTQLSYVTYDLPQDGSGQQNDCPRFYTRTDWANNWNNNDVVNTAFDGDLSSWGSVTTPDEVTHKEFFGAGGTWQRGLTVRSETWHNQALKKYSTFSWTNDNLTVTYPLRPKLIETDVHDDANNRRRTTTKYTGYSLPSDVYEYGADAATVLRRTHIDYNLSAVYTNRRIIGLPSARYVYDGNGYIYTGGTYNNPNEILVSKDTFDYDQSPDPYLQHQGPPVQHDTANYGPGFVQGRGNLNVIRRWDVTDPSKMSKSAATMVGYNTSGSVVFRRYPFNHETSMSYHETSMSYEDSFSDDQNDRNTLAYPTMMTDADQFSSSVQYNYDFGAVTRTQDPKLAAVTRTYDAAGRVERVKIEVAGAYTRYVYAPDQSYVQSFTTINDLSPANEFYSITAFDGGGRTLVTASDHPTSVGQYKAQRYSYDVMGRLVGQTNPTETDADLAPAGDDEAGWASSSQSYDWEGRTTIFTNQDGTTKSISYEGCGCAGGQKVVLIDEVGRRQEQNFDILGRMWRERTYNWGGANETGVYSTTTNTYNIRDQITNISVIAKATGVSQNTVMTYDGHSRLKTRKNPIESAATGFAYNPDDTLQTTTDARGVTKTYEYNNRHLITKISYGTVAGVVPLNPVTFGYDVAGNRVWMDDQPGRVDYHYDMLSQMDWEERRFDIFPEAYRINYEYNLAGQLKTVGGPFDTSYTYVFNRAGEITGITGSGYADFDSNNNRNITQLAADVSYHAWGGLKSFTNNDLATEKTSFSYGYNTRLQLTRFDGGGRVTEHTYYNDGRVKDVTDHAYANFNRTHSYDHVGRLTQAGAGTAIPKPYNFTYGYDEWGNTTSRTGTYWNCDDPNFFADYTDNRSIAMDYDAAGNVTRPAHGSTDPTWEYDAAGLFTNALYPLPSNYTKETHGYDGDGRQVYYNTYSRYDPNFLGGQYFVLSSMLGGEVLGVIDQGTNSHNKRRSNVYLHGERIAYQDWNYTGAPNTRLMFWTQRNPVTSSAYEHRRAYVVPGTLFDDVRATAVDPVGAEVKMDANPCGSSGSQPPGYGYVGNIQDYRGGCYLDGGAIPCDVAMQMVNGGVAVRSPDSPVYRSQVFVYFKAYANGFQGFVPMTARVNDRGAWYDPVSKTEGHLQETDPLQSSGFLQQQGGGGLKVNVTYPAQAFGGNCGSVLQGIEWLLPKGVQTGFVVQHVKVSVNITDAAGAKVNNPNNQEQDYYEAFEVKNGAVVGRLAQARGNVDDRYQTAGERLGTRGIIDIKGRARFFNALPSIAGGKWAINTNGPSGDLQHTPGNKPPTGWKDQGAVVHDVKIDYNCLKGSSLPPNITSNP